MKKNVFLLTVMCFLILGGNVLVGAEARAANSSRPDGTSNFLLYYMTSSSDKLYSSGDKILGKNELKTNMGLLRYSYYYDLKGLPMTSQFAIPFGKAELSSSGYNFEGSGLGDLTLINGFWIKNDFENQEWYGPVFYLTIPTGEYYKNEVLNMGKNRYSLNSEFVYGKGFGPHQIDLGLSCEVFGEDKDKKLKQDPIYRFDIHYSKIFLRSNVYSIGYLYKTGGEEEDHDIKKNNKLKNHTVRLENTSMLSRHIALTLRYDKDLSVENGFKTDNVELRFTYLLD